MICYESPVVDSSISYYIVVHIILRTSNFIQVCFSYPQGLFQFPTYSPPRAFLTYGTDPEEEAAVTVVVLCGLPLAFHPEDGARLDVGGRRCCRLFLRDNRVVRLCRGKLRDGDRHLGQSLVNHPLGVAPIGTLTPDRTKKEIRQEKNNKTKVCGIQGRHGCACIVSVVRTAGASF